MSTGRIAAMRSMLDQIEAKLQTMYKACSEGTLSRLTFREGLTNEEVRQFETVFERAFKEITGVSPSEELDWVPKDVFISRHRVSSTLDRFYWGLLWIISTRTALDYLAGYALSQERSHEMSILGDLESKQEVIIEAYEVVAMYEFYLKGNAPQPLRVKILRDHGGRFIPAMSHYVQCSGALGPHRPSWHPQSSIEEAVQEVFRHGLMYYDPEDDGAKWEANDAFVHPRRSE